MYCREAGLWVQLFIYCCLQYIPACSFGFMPPVKPTMSIKVSLNSQSLLLLSFYLLDIRLLTYVKKHRRQHNLTLLRVVIRNNNGVSIPPLSRRHFLRNTSRVESTKHIFSPVLSPVLLVHCAVIYRLPHLSPHSVTHPQSPSPTTPLLISLLSLLIRLLSKGIGRGQDYIESCY